MFGKPESVRRQAGFNSYMIASLVVFGFENKRISLSSTLSLASTWIKLAIHTGSCKAFREEGCSVMSCQNLLLCHSTLPPRFIPHIPSATPGSTNTYLRFGCIGTCHVVHLPCFSAVFTIHDAGIRYTGRVDKLSREY